MSFSIGLIGLPNVGKSTLFSALTKKRVDRANYPFCTIDPNVGVVTVPDKRLEKISKTAGSLKTVPTTIEFIDIAGLVKNAHKGEGLGNQFLSHIREVDAICHVVRTFTDKNVIHVHEKIDPANDIAIINLELVMADLNTLTKHLDALKKRMKANKSKEDEKLLALYERGMICLEKEQLLSTLEFNKDELQALRELNLLTIKPLLTVLNVDESEATSGQNNLPPSCIKISAKIEAELGELPPEEAKQFLEELRLSSTGLDRLIIASYKLLDLITFYTINPKEARASTLTKDSLVTEAAGKIHSDMEKGFIKAELIAWENFIKTGGWNGAKDKGLVRIEGKDYIMQDGDVVYFYFNK